jgi:outer membrane immunogenic protein
VPPGGGFGSVSDTSRVGSGYGLVAGRVGVAFERLLLYTKLGVAFFDSAATITDASNLGFFATASKFQSPFTVGGGAEYAIFDHWTGKFEYMFVDRGTAFNACGGGFCWRQDLSTTHIVKIGLNYKF